MSNLNTKDVILALLDEVQQRKNIFRKKMVQLKKIDDTTEAILMSCGAISISNLFVTMATVNPVTLIVGSVFATVNTVGSAVKRVVDIKAKYESCKTTVNQLSDLERETRAVLSRNHLEKKDLESILDDMNMRISLIEDSSLPLELPVISSAIGITFDK
jgi:prefoldin subunit 5